MTSPTRFPALTRTADLVGARAAAASYSASALLYSVVAFAALVFLVGAFIANYYGLDVIASLSFIANDPKCPGDDPASTGMGVHCFGDYYQVVEFSRLPNPWENSRSNYAAAGMLPNLVIGSIGLLFSARTGLIIFLVILIGCLIAPAIWASRGKSAWVRIVTIGLFGVLTVPAIAVIDRGSNLALAVPALLAFLVGLRRDNDRMTGAAIVLASLIRPQFILGIAVLIARRKWKAAGLTTLAVGVTNLLAYLAYPTAFPGSLIDTLRGFKNFGAVASLSSDYPVNVSFSKALFEIAALFTPESATDALSTVARTAGTVVALGLVLAIMILGKRIPAHVSGILILAVASLAPNTSWSYYLVFALPVAAVLLRDAADAVGVSPTWHGVLDDEGANRLRAIAGVTITLATAASLYRILLPETISTEVLGIGPQDNLVVTTAIVAPILWLIAAIFSLVAWGRRASV